MHVVDTKATVVPPIVIARATVEPPLIVLVTIVESTAHKQPVLFAERRVYAAYMAHESVLFQQRNNVVAGGPCQVGGGVIASQDLLRGGVDARWGDDVAGEGLPAEVPAGRRLNRDRIVNRVLVSKGQQAREIPVFLRRRWHGVGLVFPATRQRIANSLVAIHPESPVVPVEQMRDHQRAVGVRSPAILAIVVPRQAGQVGEKGVRIQDRVLQEVVQLPMQQIGAGLQAGIDVPAG